ncbi:MAG: sensor domain-containing diguanylate cyclase [Gammaproteobacteria bacterium]
MTLNNGNLSARRGSKADTKQNRTTIKHNASKSIAEAEASAIASAKYEAAFTNSPHYKAISRLSDGVLVEVNDAVEQITGFSREEAIGKTTTELGLWVDPDQHDRCVALARSGKPVRDRVKYRVKGGRILDCELTVWIFKAGAEEYVLGSLDDRTQLIAAEKAKHESDLRFRSLFEHTPDAILIVDDSGAVEFANIAAAKLFASRREAITEEDLDDLIPALKSMYLKGKFAGFANFQKPDTDTNEPIVTSINRRGVERPVHLFVNKFSTLDGDRFSITLRDISEQVEAVERSERLNVELRDTIDVLEQLNRNNAILSDMIDLLHACADNTEAAQITSHFLPQLLPGEFGALYLAVGEQATLSRVAVWGEDFQARETMQINDCWALRRGRSFEMRNTDEDIVCEHVTPSSAPYQLCFPLLAHGEVIGLLHLGFNEIIDAVYRSLTQTVADHISLGMANIRLREDLRAQAYRDPLTGLFNRRHLKGTMERELNRCVRNKSPLSVWIVDVDHFKTFNDSYGHDAGDVVLKAVAQELVTRLRAEDLVYRYGGEEFLALLPDFPVEKSMLRAEQACEEIKALRIQHDGKVLPAVTVSIGVSNYPDCPANIKALLQCADQAMYHAKENGRDQVSVAPRSKVRDASKLDDMNDSGVLAISDIAPAKGAH